MERVVFREAIQGLEVEQVVRDFEYSMTTRHFHETYELYFLKMCIRDRDEGTLSGCAGADQVSGGSERISAVSADRGTAD